MKPILVDSPDTGLLFCLVAEVDKADPIVPIAALGLYKVAGWHLYDREKDRALRAAAARYPERLTELTALARDNNLTLVL